jgi:hypothetical protein
MRTADGQGPKPRERRKDVRGAGPCGVRGGDAGCQDARGDRGYCPNPNFWTLGENAFWGWSYGAGAAAPTAHDPVTWWMGSLGHPTNILNPNSAPAMPWMCSISASCERSDSSCFSS